MNVSSSFNEVRQRLREIEDKNIALQLQEEEFTKYYKHNREYRSLVGEDTKYSIKEQANEDKMARHKRTEAIQKIAESDEEMARRMQQRFEEERQWTEEQVRRDAELARALADDVSHKTSSSARVILPLKIHGQFLPTSSSFENPKNKDEPSEQPASSVTDFSDMRSVDATVSSRSGVFH